MTKLTNHSKMYFSHADEVCRILHRSNSFPSMKQDSPVHLRLQMHDKRPNETESCVLFEKRNRFLRLENAKGECFLARGVKYNRDANPARKKIALIMLLRAAMNGSSQALEELHDCYRRGIGTAANEKVALQLLRAFLEQSVETSFLDDLLKKASTCNESLSHFDFLAPSSAHCSRYKGKESIERSSRLCFPLGIKIGYTRTSKKPSHRIFCFISD